MKNIIIFFVTLTLQWSCQQVDGLDPTAGDPPLSTVMMEMELHQTTMDQYVVPNEEQHADFISSDLISLMAQKGMSGIKKRSDDQADTIFSYHEIPLIRETKTNLLIYQDGRSEMILEDLTPNGINPLYLLTETPPENTMLLSRTHIKDGRLKIYDKNNDLMVDEVYPEENLKDFTDSLLRFLSTSNQSKINSLRDSKLPPGIHRVALPDGTVQIEQLLGSMPASVHAVTGSEPLKAIAVLNEEMNKTLKFEVYSGRQLIHRKTFEYEESNWLKNCVNEKEFSVNPKLTESETLQMSAEGIPVIYTSKTVYHRHRFLVRIAEEEVKPFN